MVTKVDIRYAGLRELQQFLLQKLSAKQHFGCGIDLALYLLGKNRFHGKIRLSTNTSSKPTLAFIYRFLLPLGIKNYFLMVTAVYTFINLHTNVLVCIHS